MALKCTNAQAQLVPVTATAYSLTIAEFCAQQRISRAMFYRLQKIGRGPRFMRVGRAVRITGSAIAEWQAAMEAS